MTDPLDDGPASKSGLERNAALYPWYAALHATYFWMPVFVLFLVSHVGLANTLRLEAIYYVAFFVLEVPSGWFSDRIGRRPTLLISSVALVASYSLFALGSGFAIFAVAQLLLAVGLAFNSGTDASFHLDSLATAGREHEYADREAIVSRSKFIATALGALVGGLAGWLDLRLAYGLAACSALVATVIALRFVEPPRAEDDVADPLHTQLVACIRLATRSPLSWLALVAIVATVINHIPYELYQPYIRRAFEGHGLSSFASATPMVTGVHATLVSLVAVRFAGRSASLTRRYGVRTVLLASLALQVLIIGSMALVLHLGIAALLLLRSVPRALQEAPLNATVAPRVSTTRRATYLSLISLVGRLSFGLLLLGLATEADALASWPVLRNVAWHATLVGVGLLVVVGIGAYLVGRIEAPGLADG